ncbi:hypothetical protein [Amycolatopsis aidingensis]|uniref:hypothetical protein n=1 Tax=Amycolatopsis aidingensis TaxID=2842453 RepID=UPI001E2A3D31|nr:hypothetical protein [Amycolatopsis aidingensis]
MLGAFVCVVLVVVLLAGMAVLSVTGVSFDPHGYGLFAAILMAAVLTPAAVLLWVLYRSMRRGGGYHGDHEDTDGG